MHNGGHVSEAVNVIQVVGEYDRRRGNIRAAYKNSRAHNRC
jgi:hypothetical protein